MRREKKLHQKMLALQASELAICLASFPRTVEMILMSLAASLQTPRRKKSPALEAVLPFLQLWVWASLEQLEVEHMRPQSRMIRPQVKRQKLRKVTFTLVAQASHMSPVRLPSLLPIPTWVAMQRLEEALLPQLLASAG
jgi:hypothetical protein